MQRSLDVYHDMDGKRRPISVDEQIRRLAVRQHGIVTRRQLLDLGLGRGLIDHQLATHGLEIVHRGIYALSRALLSREGRWLAAVRAVGSDAVLSHHAAAAHSRIRPSAPGVIDVTCPRRIRSRSDIRCHCLPLAADEVVEHDGIPVTTPARTVFDLAASLRSSALMRALREAEFLRLRDGPSLPELVERYPGRTGVQRVRALIANFSAETRTRSELEERFLEFVDRSALPRPEVNALVRVGEERLEVDFLWRRERLVVELDGYASHATRFAFEADRRRDRLLQLAGFDVFRVTGRQLAQAAAELLADLRRRLGVYA